MYMVTADYTLNDNDLEGATFPTCEGAWLGVAYDLARTDAGLTQQQMDDMVSAALTRRNEPGMLEMSDGCHVEVIEVEAHKVVGTYMIENAAEEDAALVGDTVYWLPKTQIWVHSEGDEIDVDMLTLERIVD